MAIIPKYTLNEKFENGKKPPQWDFWAWQDSYWHKEEKIPTSAIEGLDATLLKKADLVDGMVPESQLPFSVVTSEVISLGTVEVIDNKVKLEVHSSGANKVRVKGKLITRIFPNEWPFTPIAGNGIKVLRGYAVKNEDDFFMVEGAELPEMTDPEIPENALQLFSLTISAAGVIVEEETEEVFKYRSDDNWRPLIINTNAGVWLQFGGTGASSFNITVSGFVTTPKIVGLSTKVTKNIWNGKDILLYIDSDVPVSIVKDQTLPTAPNATFINFAEDYILQPKSYNLIKQKGNQIVVVKYGGGSANFPAGGSDGEVLLKSGTGGIWSSIVKGVEFLGNAWLKLKLISFQGYSILQKNAIASPTEGMLIYQNENPKGFQKYEGGAWTAIGSNISNADLTTVSARTFNQGNIFTWFTNGFDFYVKGNLKTDAVILTNNSSAPVVGRLRSDGTDVFFTNNLEVERSLSAAYKAEYQQVNNTTQPVIGNLLLKRSFEKVLYGSLGGACIFTIVLETPKLGVVNEHILLFGVGAGAVPNITYPPNIKWRGRSPLFLTQNTSYTMIFEQVWNGLIWEVWALYIENER